MHADRSARTGEALAKFSGTVSAALYDARMEGVRVSMPSRQPRLRPHENRWTGVGGLCLCAFGFGLAWLTWWLLTTKPIGQWDGKLWLIALLSPVVVIMSVSCVLLGLGAVERSLRRYRIDAKGVRVHGLWHHRFARWDEVADFTAPPGPFPRPPQHVVLYLRHGRPIEVPLTLRPKGVIAEALGRYVPVIAEHGLDRARQDDAPLKRPASWHGERLMSGLVKLVGGFIFTLMCLAVGVMLSWEFINALRIAADPVEVPAEVMAIVKDDDRTRVTVKFTDEAGNDVTLKRSVLADFPKHHGVGQEVTVQHLAGSPQVARVHDWDTDRRQVFILLLVLPFAWISLGGVQSGLQELRRPSHFPFGWAVGVGDPFHVVLTTSDELEINLATWPDRHSGDRCVVLLSLRVTDEHSTFNFGGLAEQGEAMDKHGIETKLVDKRFLLLAPNAAKLMFDRLGREPKTRAEYFIAPSADPAETEAWALRILRSEHGDKTEEVEQLRDTPFFCRQHLVGPLNADELQPAFNRWMTQQVGRLYDFSVPRELKEADWFGLLAMKGGVDAANLLIEKRHGELRIHRHRMGEREARRATLAAGVWRTMDAVRLPAALRPRTWRRRIGQVAMAPVGLLITAALLTAMPLVWLAGRGRRQTTARQAGER